MAFAQNLVRLQAEHGESSYRLAREIEATQTTVANWRAGKNFPHLLYRKKLADHYGITVEELIK